MATPNASRSSLSNEEVQRCCSSTFTLVLEASASLRTTICGRASRSGTPTGAISKWIAAPPRSGAAGGVAGLARV